MISGSYNNLTIPKADLVICADVIKHVDDPDALIGFLVKRARYWIVVSTPDRDLMYGYRLINKHYHGPPKNPSHIREWTMPEFGCYVREFVKIERHAISNRHQGAQMIVARAMHSYTKGIPAVASEQHINPTKAVSHE
jgi:hypothetical protein